MNYKVLAIAMLVAVVGFAQEGAAPAVKPKPVTAAEVQKARPTPEQMADKMFADADTNKDGVLSKEEFTASMKKRMEGRGGMGGPGMGRGPGMGGQGGQGNGPRGGMKAPPMAE